MSCKTYNIWLAGYMVSKGVSLISIERNDNKVNFVFNIDKAKFDEIKIEFLNSDMLRVKKAVDNLKDIINERN